MSATNRGSERIANDYYSTPPWAVDGILDRLSIKKMSDDMCFIDPGCGDGAILDRLVKHAGVYPESIIGIEIDKERSNAAKALHEDCSILHSDFLGPDTTKYLADNVSKPAAIICNPPYSQALEFAERCLSIADMNKGSFICFLLRLGFLETKKRRLFHEKNPAHVFVMPKRPSFCHSFKCKSCEVKFNKPTSVERFECPGCSKNMIKTVSDATAYAWMCWGENTRPGTWEIF